MQFPESWLREFCDPPLTTRRTGRHAHDGRPRGRGAATRSRRRSPRSWSARSRKSCSIRTPTACACARSTPGTGALLNIVCGAPNARAGIKVPCALVGAELPPGEDGKPFEIKLGKLRGVESQGMLCSARELKLSRRPRRPAGAAGRRAGRHGHPRGARSSTTRCSRSSSRPTWRTACRVLRRRARSCRR